MNKIFAFIVCVGMALASASCSSCSKQADDEEESEEIEWSSRQAKIWIGQAELSDFDIDQCLDMLEIVASKYDRYDPSSYDGGELPAFILEELAGKSEEFREELAVYLDLKQKLRHTLFNLMRGSEKQNARFDAMLGQAHSEASNAVNKNEEQEMKNMPELTANGIGPIKLHGRFSYLPDAVGGLYDKKQEEYRDNEIGCMMCDEIYGWFTLKGKKTVGVCANSDGIITHIAIAQPLKLKVNDSYYGVGDDASKLKAEAGVKLEASTDIIPYDCTPLTDFAEPDQVYTYKGVTIDVIKGKISQIYIFYICM